MSDSASKFNLLASYLRISALAVKRARLSKDAAALSLVLLTPLLHLFSPRGALDTGGARIRYSSREELRAIMYGFFKTYFCYSRVLSDRFHQNSFSTIVDVGANMGDFALAMSEKSREVIAVEPGTENFRRLKDNIQRNRIKNIIAVRVAAHDKDEWLNLGGNNSDRHVSSNGGELVNGVRLDALLDDPNAGDIDVVKIDVQGHEEQVLSGLQGLLASGRIKMAIVEVHPKRGVSRSSIVRKLDSSGYHLAHEDSYLFGQPQLYFLRSHQPSREVTTPSMDHFTMSAQNDIPRNDMSRIVESNT